MWCRKSSHLLWKDAGQQQAVLSRLYSIEKQKRVCTRVLGEWRSGAACIEGEWWRCTVNCVGDVGKRLPRVPSRLGNCRSLQMKEKKCIFNSVSHKPAKLAKQDISYNLAASRWAVNVFIPPLSHANECINRKMLLEISQTHSEKQRAVNRVYFLSAALLIFQMIHWQPRVYKQRRFHLILTAIAALNY